MGGTAEKNCLVSLMLLLLAAGEDVTRVPAGSWFDPAWKSLYLSAVHLNSETLQERNSNLQELGRHQMQLFDSG